MKTEKLSDGKDYEDVTELGKFVNAPKGNYRILREIQTESSPIILRGDYCKRTGDFHNCVILSIEKGVVNYVKIPSGLKDCLNISLFKHDIQCLHRDGRKIWERNGINEQNNRNL